MVALPHDQFPSFPGLFLTAPGPGPTRLLIASGRGRSVPSPPAPWCVECLFPETEYCCWALGGKSVCRNSLQLLLSKSVKAGHSPDKHPPSRAVWGAISMPVPPHGAAILCRLRWWQNMEGTKQYKSSSEYLCAGAPEPRNAGGLATPAKSGWIHLVSTLRGRQSY